VRLWENSLVEPFQTYDPLSTFGPVFTYLSQYPIGWLVFVVVGTLWALYSLVLLYHWFRYGVSPLAILVAMILYFGVSLSLLGTLLTATQAL